MVKIDFDTLKEKSNHVCQVTIDTKKKRRSRNIVSFSIHFCYLVKVKVGEQFMYLLKMNFSGNSKLKKHTIRAHLISRTKYA